MLSLQIRGQSGRFTYTFYSILCLCQTKLVFEWADLAKQQKSLFFCGWTKESFSRYSQWTTTVFASSWNCSNVLIYSSKMVEQKWRQPLIATLWMDRVLLQVMWWWTQEHIWRTYDNHNNTRIVLQVMKAVAVPVAFGLFHFHATN